MKPAIVWDPAYSEHDTGDHPEGPDRVDSIVSYLKTTALWPRLAVERPRPATVDDVLLVHTPAEVETVREAAAAGGRWLDSDTYVSPRSFEIALLSTGGALRATELWSDGLAPFALIRPPGHHATPDQAMGFCLFNNVAIAAARLLAGGLERIAIVDWDVHHGNGTQAAFYADPRVLFCSVHEWPLYPGSGSVNECGEGAGEGFTVNIPLPAGARDGDYVRAFERVVEPVVGQFAPQAVLVSAGEDVSLHDPLASMLVTEAGFAQMALRCLRLAQASAEGRLAFVLEGGYDRPATARAVEAVLSAVADEQAPPATGLDARAAAAVERAAQAQAWYWDL